MKFIRLIVLIFLAAGWQSCSTELEVNAPYKETKVLYGVLDPTLPFQTFRIGKGFLSDGRSALDISKNSPDSSLFRPGNLEVTLFEMKLLSSGRYDTLQKVKLFADTINNKEAGGDFYAPDQMVFRTPLMQLDTLNAASQIRYRILVRNKISGKESEAFTQVPGRDLRITNPASINGEGPTGKESFELIPLLMRRTNPAIEARVFRSTHSSAMQMFFKWKVQNFFSADTTEEVWVMKSGIESNLIQAEASIKIGAGVFYDFLKVQSAQRRNADLISRRLLPCEMEVYAANQDFDNYRVVNGNYNAITQSQPVYSNISNGALGIFCAVNRKSFPVSVKLKQTEIDSINKYAPEMKLIK